MLAKELSWVFVIKVIAILMLGHWIFGKPISKTLTPDRFAEHLVSDRTPAK